MKLKVCGMKLNTAEVAELRPDYLGFIFWEKSSRFFDGVIPALSESIEKIGVFVNAPIEEILEKIKEHDLQGVQLHGDESPEFCKKLRSSSVVPFKIIKVFSIKNSFDFSILKSFEPVSDYFLFDTKGKLPGGNGYAFDWEILKNYPSTKPYFLSGGIGLKNANSLDNFKKLPESRYCFAIDVNSHFETEPGLKDLNKLNKFKTSLSINSAHDQ